MSERKKVHQGRNIRRFREMLGLKQEALAWELGEEWSQKRVSAIEQKESVNDDILERVADVLKIPVEAFRNFDEEQAINFISNTISNNDSAVMNGPSLYNHHPTFNPFEKWVEALDEIKQLHAGLLRVQEEKLRIQEEKVELYERMLKEKDGLVGRLEQLLAEGKK